MRCLFAEKGKKLCLKCGKIINLRLSKHRLMQIIIDLIQYLCKALLMCALMITNFTFDFFLYDENLP